MKKPRMLRITYYVPQWAASAIRLSTRRGPERDRLLAHLAVATEDALQRPRTLLAEFEALYRRYARQRPQARVRLRIPQNLATRLTNIEAAGIRPWIVLVVAAARMAITQAGTVEERTADLHKLRPGGEFEVDLP